MLKHGNNLHVLTRLCLLAACLLLGVALTTASAAGLSRPVTITWLESVPTHSAIVYAGGYLGAPRDCTYEIYTGCTLWAAGSSDAGATWHSLGSLGEIEAEYALHEYVVGGTQVCSGLRNPFMLSPNGTDLFFDTIDGYCSADARPAWLASRDQGQNWSTLADSADPVFNHYAEKCCAPDGPLAVSPANPKRLYLEVNPTDNGYALFMARSDDAGQHWQLVGSEGLTSIDGQDTTPYTTQLLADPTNQQVVYMALPGPGASRWARSEDGGVTWHLLVAPGRDLRATFLLTTDRHLPHGLVAQLTSQGVPTDRRYESFDHGRTWKAITCPGDLHGQCPAFTLDDVFGKGHAYGFYRDGVHAFTGGGPAGLRLGLSGNLPCKLNTLIDVAGGGKTALLLCQDPKVPLATGPNITPGLLKNPNLSGVLYRSADGGKSWHTVIPEVSPPIPNTPPLQ